ncbi:TIR domain-containing protein [Bowdeniella nasicola]|uniref:TIR domain-containing protein n=1 Tax=Bowdeniella nasicola TaxID=208480 RepID=A0A1H4BRB8_9ACTO|nr:toll/interleukin-1 receptor domain-containing protein [Bowdeniella nasicola]SEA50654.1 TIR domain-containing protein [Bowdeniella nasicola]
MPVPRMPSQSQIRSQMRAAQRKAEQQFERDLKAAQRKAENEVKAQQRRNEQAAQRKIDKWVRDTNRKLQSASRPSVTYRATEDRTLGAVATEAERQAAAHPERRDVFLCHAWGDRQGAAQELHDLLERFGVSVWFSEKDVALGTSLVREIDKGLRMSHIGIVLATPNLLRSLAAEGIADKELSALLATDRVIPVVHGITYEELRDESPLLASRSGLSTGEDTLEQVAVKIANAVRPESD